jgi:hypothetical protein
MLMVEYVCLVRQCLAVQYVVGRSVGLKVDLKLRTRNVNTPGHQMHGSEVRSKHTVRFAKERMNSFLPFISIHHCSGSHRCHFTT